MSQPFVLDASVVVKLFVQEELSDKAQQLLERLTGSDATDALYAPDFTWVECANVLWKYVCFHGYDVREAEHNVRALLDLAIRPIGAGELLDAGAFRLAHSYSLPLYDACYLALAEHLGATFITADQRLVKRVAGRSDVLYLGDWSG
jgi:predicted nucleic acid-binding protein